jgi:uncharacterized protein (TIGR02996 family)
MHTGDALLQAIAEEPQDDSLRLIYADWLHDHGEPEHAEYIRLEITLHTLYQTPDLTDAGLRERDQLAQRRDALFDAHRERWFRLALEINPTLATTRGFVDFLSMTARTFVERAAELAAEIPVLSALSLRALGDNVPAVAARPELARIRELTIWESTLGSAGLAELCRSPHLGGLRELDLNGSRVGPEGGRALGQASALAGLRLLDLRSNPVRDRGVRAVVSARHFAGLEALSLEDCLLTDSHADDLAAADHLTHLRTLSLHNNGLTARGLARLASAQHLASVRSLSLGGNPLASGLTALGQSPVWANLGGDRRRGTGRPAALAGRGRAGDPVLQWHPRPGSRRSPGDRHALPQPDRVEDPGQCLRRARGGSAGQQRPLPGPAQAVAVELRIRAGSGRGVARRPGAGARARAGPLQGQPRH